MFVLEKGGVLLLGTVLLLGHIRYIYIYIYIYYVFYTSHFYLKSSPVRYIYVSTRLHIDWFTLSSNAELP